MRGFHSRWAKLEAGAQKLHSQHEQVSQLLGMQVTFHRLQAYRGLCQAP